MLEQFPEQILQLSQLRCLLVTLICETNFVLPRVLLCCAEWPNPTTLHIDVWTGHCAMGVTDCNVAAGDIDQSA